LSASAKSGEDDEATPKDLSSLLQHLVDETDGKHVTLGELLETFGERSFGPLLLIPSIIAVAPTGAIPGMSIVTGTIIIMVAVQMLIGRNYVWLPNRVTSFEFERSTLKSAVAKAQPWTDRMDGLMGRRFAFLATWPLNLAIPRTLHRLGRQYVSVGPAALRRCHPGDSRSAPCARPDVP
jgi:hypothetical protein